MTENHCRCVHVSKILRVAVAFLAFFTSSSFSQVTTNIADQYFEDIANPLTLDWDVYKDYAVVAFEVVDVDQDGLKDIIIHFWKQHSGDEFNGTTPNILKVFKLRDDMTFIDFTQELLGSDIVDLGGASRNIEISDLNRDGKPDIVFSINQEDGRITSDDNSDGQLAAMISTSTGYEIIKFGTFSFFHSLGVGKLANGHDFVTGNGFTGGIKAELYSFSSSNQPILNDSGDLEIPPNGFRFLSNEMDYSTQLIRNANHPYMFGIMAYELIDNKWTKTDEILDPYPKIGEIQFKGWNGASYDTADVIDIGGIPSIGQGGYSYAESCGLKVYPEADEIVVLKLNSAEIPNFGDQEYYEQNELINYNILMGFDINNSELVTKPLNIKKEAVSTNYNFIDCSDIDGDSYQDIVAYTYGAIPSIYINDQNGGFYLLTDSRIPDIQDPTIWPENSAAASVDETSILRDFTGDGIPDLFFLPSYVPPIDFGNDFADGIGLKFFVGTQYLTKNRLDTDQDGVSDETDNCLQITNSNQTDSDLDGVGDVCDALPLDPLETIDTDSDGIGNNADDDDDGDGVIDVNDTLPLDPTNDSDNDGVANNADAYPEDSLYSEDTDLDGLPDSWELIYGLDPNDSSDASSDQDDDGVTALYEFLAGTIPLGSLDLDGNGQYDALTDGLLLLRSMFGLDGGTLVSGAIAPDAAYTSASDIEARVATLGNLADIDGNGDIDALTDGLLVLRFLFGLAGDPLFKGILAPNSTRTEAEILGFLGTLSPVSVESYAVPEVLSANWTDYNDDLDILGSIYQSYPWKLNVDPLWFTSLQIPSSEFSRSDYILDTSSEMGGGVGYGSYLNVNSTKQYIFYSNWQPGVPTNGNAWMVTLEDGAAVSVVSKKIAGATRTHVLKNKDGSKMVVLPGIDEGELSIGLPGDAASYAFNLETLEFNQLNLEEIAAHDSITFDFENDGDDDIMTTTWGPAYDGHGLILKNDNGLLKPIQVKMPMGCCGYPLGYSMNSPFYEDNKLGVVMGDAYLPSHPELNIADDHNFIAYFDPSMSNEPESYTQLPLPYFERDEFSDIPEKFTDGQHTSHDVASRVFDIDKDGDKDIIISSMLWSDDYPLNIIQILVNHEGIYVDETDTRLYNWISAGPGHHQIDIADINNDGFQDILLSDHGDAWFNRMFSGEFSLKTSIGAGSKVLLNDGEGHFVTVAHQYITKPFSHQASHIPSLTNSNLLKWTSISVEDQNPNQATVEVVSLNSVISTGPNGINPDTLGVPGFNEFYYLLHNEEARTAVKSGEFESGLEHYLARGQWDKLSINAN